MSIEQPSVPYGFCHCGCGERAPLAPYSQKSKGWVKGEPLKCVAGHSARYAVLARWRDQGPRYVEEDRGYDTPCWIWQRAVGRDGYGRVTRSGVSCLAHRIVYEEMRGAIPEGLTLDHLCRVRACVNPFHMEPVSLAENKRRGNNPSAQNARKTHCKRGHEFTPENTYVERSTGYRKCRACITLYWQAQARRG